LVSNSLKYYLRKIERERERERENETIEQT